MLTNAHHLGVEIPNPIHLDGLSLPKEKDANHDALLKMGTSVVSGYAKAKVIKQDASHSFSTLLDYLAKVPKISYFSVSLKKFANFLMKVTFIFVAAIVIILIALKQNPFNSFLFGLAIAIGLSPQLLPAILTTNLALGAKRMAKVGALTKKLDSIENFGNMDLLCCDKTGTLTKGKIEMYAACDIHGLPSLKVRKLGYINAILQSGFENALDKAIVESNHFDHTSFSKLDEIPYDFNRKKVSVLAYFDNQNKLITKGALESILDSCNLSPSAKEDIFKIAESFYKQGFKVLGLASKIIDKKLLEKTDEHDLSFEGFLLFYDPIKEDCLEVIKHLKDLKIRLVMITGDHPIVASYVAEKAGFLNKEAVDHVALQSLDANSLEKTLINCDVYARMEPLDKSKLIESFKKMGYTVGFLGDGINDSAAIHVADVGISVESGADMTKAISDFVLVNKHLSILIHAVKEGRKVFGNTLKYILLAVSSNFGNMFSMAGISLFIPFLPLLPTQILLINLLQDIPEMGLADDQVDHDLLIGPQKWNIDFIKKFMLVFGPISSLFDYATFFFMFYLSATVEQFRSAWFTESVISATFIIFFIRTRHKIFKSKPSILLSSLIFLIIGLTLSIPYTPLGPLFDIIPLPMSYYAIIFGIVITYALMVEWIKGFFYRWIHRKHGISLS